ncbi:MAG: PQQ-binding-like beta-propeller repeat protein [Gemmataceae bacterium]|nr:PQQ-binding-like beta-propeller repeat protein [Gemmataceae bacterium]
MARRLCVLLSCTMGLALARPTTALDGPGQVKADEQRLQAAGLKHDGPALLQFFRQRSLTDSERASVELLIQRLGARAFKVREQAAADLVARGPVVLEQLGAHLKNPDPEVSRRAQQCIDRIKEKDLSPEIPAAAARLLLDRKPAGTLETLLAYLPFAGNEAVADEVRGGLARLALRDGKPEKALVAALKDKHPVRRAAAAEAFCQARVEGPMAVVEKMLLKDPEPSVRLRVAMAMAREGNRRAVQELIDLLVPLPQAQAWQAEDILFRLAEGKDPPSVSLGSDEASRKKCRDAWAKWWQDKGATVNLAKLREPPRLLGHTIIVLLDMNRVMEINGQNKILWKVDNLHKPLDAQYLPNERILVAEYDAAQVTERDLTGMLKWRYQVAGPLVAQRLRNGNTFIATDGQLMEVNEQGKRVFEFAFPDGQRIMKACKLANGEMVCLTSAARVVRLDATGKELKSFPVNLGQRLFGGRIHMLPNGRVLVPHHSENKVIEYDVDGKVVWEVAIEQPIAATRLPDGNTLVTSMNQNRAVEFDRNGKEVWQYRSDTRVTRAVRR